MPYVTACTALAQRLLVPEDFDEALDRASKQAKQDAADPMRPGQVVRLRLISHSLLIHPNGLGVWLTTVWRYKVLK